MRTETNPRRLTAMAAAVALILAACSSGGSDDSDPTTTTTTEPAEAGQSSTDGSPGGGSRPGSGSATDEGRRGLRLSEGSAASVDVDPVALVEGDVLSDDEIAAVLDRLPDWDVSESDVAEFNRPAETLSPPTVGETIEAEFPPAPDAPSAPDATADGPLEVVRMQPEGDVDVAPFIALTFDEPMVELATLDQLDDIDVPVTVTPDLRESAGIDGRWRWIGTRTLRFEVTPEPGSDDGNGNGNGGLDRLPAATEYTVTVPNGTESVNGAVLDDAVSFSFTTPAATVTSLSGLADSMGLDPVFVATFDQRVDPAAVLDVTAFEAGDVTGVRLATDAEIDADDNARQVVGQTLPDRAVAFVPTSTLPTDSRVQIKIGPDVPSLEGSRTDDSTFSESGRTYAPLKVTRTDCFDGCPPFSPFSIIFNNQLDRDAFDPTLVEVSPSISGMRIDNFGESIQISGSTSGNTTYTVTIAPELTDVFGQTLDEEYTHDFDVGDARPFLRGPEREFVTTDPFADDPALSVTSVGHDELALVAWEVEPGQYGEFQEFLQSTYSDTRPSDPDWPVALDTTVAIDSDSDQMPVRMLETTIDLTEAFEASGGPIVVRIETLPAPDPQTDEYYENRPIYAWVQTTTLGVDAFVTDEEVLMWVTDLLTGEPVGGATVELLGTDESVTTDANGVARAPLGSGVDGLVATADGRTAMLPAQRFGGWAESDQFRQSPWYVIDDRGIYRPGETMRITGLVRVLTADDAQLGLIAADSSVRYIVRDPQGNELATGDVPVNALGGFNLSVDIAEEANTGQAFVELAAVDAAGADIFGVNTGHQFQIQDFRTPDYEVTARSESPAPYYVVDPATVAVDAEYFAGGPLGDAEVNWLVSTNDATYAPPNWDDFSFGIWTPWWFDGFDRGFGGGAYEEDFYYDDECFDCGGNSTRFEEFTGRTDGSGTHLLQIDFADTTTDDDAGGDETRPVDQPTTVTAEATVFDVNRQAISSRTNLLVHPAKFYVGLRSDRSFVEKGDPIVIDTTVVDVDGAPVAGREVEVTAGRVDFSFEEGRYVEEVVDEQTCTITSTDDVSNTDPVAAMRCEFTTDVGGEYRITAIVTDDDGRSNRAEYTQWVSGAVAPPTRGLTRGEVVIVPDSEDYAPGDTAELLVQAPFAPASGLITVTRAGVESVEAFDAPDGSAVLNVPIDDDDIPNLNVRVDMVGATDRLADDGTPLVDAPSQPAFAIGQIGLQIPPVARTLDVVATPADAEIVPGESTSVSVAVTGPDGEPVADAGVALIVVDEAVLSLSGYELLDPLAVMYQPIDSLLQPELLRDSIVLANPDLFGSGASVEGRETTDAMEDESMGESADDGALFEASATTDAAADGDFAGGADRALAAETPIDVRVDFDALAVFAPDETTGADGTVGVDVELPDNLTRYRVMAVGVDGAERFGSGESMITARLPISVRPTAPRFLNFGDRFELPVVVQNQSDEAVEVEVAIETANLDLTDGAGQRVTVPANERVEVRFPAAAAEVGTARFRVAGASGGFADAAEVDLPVYTPATAEAFATYGVVDDGGAIAQPVLAPEGVFPQFGGLEISTSSTAVQALTDAVLYLYDYRYDSADGYASRIMAVAALRDVLDAFDADGLPDPDALNARVADDIAALQALQNDDGGFPYWQRGRPSIPWVSVQSAHALVLAQQNGYGVDQGSLDRALEHLRSIEEFIPAIYSQPTKDAIGAYALYVRDLAGDSDPAKALDLYRRGTDDATLQLDSIAQLWPVITDEAARTEIETLIANSAVETPSAATFATDYGEDAYLIAYSDRRTDGIVLGALVSETPDSDLIVKVVNGLLGDQTRGRWGNAQENSFILLALNEYFDTFESVDPDFVARAWLGDTYAAEVEFRGRSTDTSLTTVPMAELIEGTAAEGREDVIVDKDGAGRLYYRLGLRYAPDDLDLDPRDEGFVVERVYEAVDDPSHVRREVDGTWVIAAGATVRVRLTMVADAQRTHVALIDPLPAGLEAVNPALETSLTVVPGDTVDDSSTAYTGAWYWRWFGHQNLRDDRAEAFATFLPGGTYEYTYVARATTPGEFVVPPTRAEEIFAPEVFGRSASASVTITG